MKYKVIVFDIDGTITTHKSSWQYLHERLGLWEDIACAYQEKFIAGKISYKKFCQLDASHWRGLSEKKLQAIFKKMGYSKNAVYSIKKLKEMGFKLVAFSTGLQFLPDRLKKELGFDFLISNRLIMRKGIATGCVRVNIPHGSKGRILRRILKRLKVRPDEVICVGDSDGDIPLAKLTGYSIAFNSTSDTFSRLVDYNCRTKDFKEILAHITAVTRRKNNPARYRLLQSKK